MNQVQQVELYKKPLLTDPEYGREPSVREMIFEFYRSGFPLDERATADMWAEKFIEAVKA